MRHELEAVTGEEEVGQATAHSSLLSGLHEAGTLGGWRAKDKGRGCGHDKGRREAMPVRLL